MKVYCIWTRTSVEVEGQIPDKYTAYRAGSCKPDKLMGSPYARIVIMHLAVLFGAFLTMALGSPVAILIILVGLKTSLDVIFHMRQHKKHQAKTAKE